MNFVGDNNANTINGTAFKDVIDGLGGDDALNGLGGNDSILGGAGGDQIFGADGKDTIRGGLDADNLQGGDDADFDFIFGDEGNDVITVRRKDHGDGGADSDYVAFYLTDLAAGNYDLSGWTSGGAFSLAGASLDGFESGFVIFGAGDDRIRAPAFHLSVYGGDGNDTVLGGAGSDEIYGAETIAQADTLKGGDGDDNLTGGSGDLIDGGAGSSDGFEVYLGYTSTDYVIDFAPLFSGQTVLFGDGTRVVRCERGAVALGIGDDKVETGSSAGVSGIRVTDTGGNDTLIGGEGNDNLSAGQGNDVIRGGAGAGRDIANYQYEAAALVIDLNLTTRQDTGGAGMDLILGCEDVHGGQSGDRITGDNNANHFEGYGGNDTLIGGQGDDTLNGGSDGGTHADRLSGGAGQDRYNGGNGDDILVWSSVFHTTVAAPDHIIGLQAGDVIHLKDIDADTTAAGDQAFTIVAAFTGVAGQLLVATNSIITQWQMDVDGDAVADALFDAQGDHTGHTEYVL